MNGLVAKNPLLLLEFKMGIFPSLPSGNHKDSAGIRFRSSTHGGTGNEK